MNQAVAERVPPLHIDDDTVPPKLRTAIDNCLNEDYKPGEPPPVPNSFKVNSPREAVKDAFEMVGGVPRLAHWADKNFDRFVNGPLAKIISATPTGTVDEPIHVKLSFDLGNRFGRTVEGVAVAEVITTPVLEEKKKKKK